MAASIVGLETKIDTILERTIVLEQVAKTVKEHDAVLYGPNKDDGLVTEFALLKDAQVKTEKRTTAIMTGLGLPLVLSLVTLVWGLITHAITLTIGR